MRRRRRRSFGLLDLVYLTLILGLLVGASLWLDRRGVVVNARVEGKRERIVVIHEPSGDWDRYYDVVAGFRGADSSHWQASVTVPRERYDALHAGDAIAVRYLAELPFLARTTDRSTASIAWELARKIAAVPLFVWLGAGLLALWIAARMGTIATAVVGAAWTYSAFPLLFSTPSPAPPAGADGVARVAGITSISRSPSTTPHSHRSAGGGSAALRRLKVPYQVVQLAIASNGGRDTVLAVDAVDSGSVAGLAFGALLPVRVDPSTPREARLAGATRGFVDANRYHMIVPVVGLGILGTLGAMSYGWRRGRQPVTPDDRQRTPWAAHLVAPLMWLTFGGTTLLSACHMERTGRRQNWPAASPGQGAAGQDAAALAGIAPKPPNPDAAATPAPATDTLLVGCSGGIRGEGRGMAVTGAGELLEWSLRGWPGHRHPYRLLRLDSVGAEAVFAAAPGASGPHYRPMPDEISCFYTLRARVRPRSGAWPEGEPPLPVLPLLDTIARVTGADRHSQWLQRQSRRTP